MVNPSPVAITVYKGMAVAVAVHCPLDNRVGGTSAGKGRCYTTVCRAVMTYLLEEHEELLALLLMHEDVLANTRTYMYCSGAALYCHGIRPTHKAA